MELCIVSQETFENLDCEGLKKYRGFYVNARDAYQANLAAEIELIKPKLTITFLLYEELDVQYQQSYYFLFAIF